MGVEINEIITPNGPIRGIDISQDHLPDGTEVLHEINPPEGAIDGADLELILQGALSEQMPDCTHAQLEQHAEALLIAFLNDPALRILNDTDPFTIVFDDDRREWHDIDWYLAPQTVTGLLSTPFEAIKEVTTLQKDQWKALQDAAQALSENE
ncbi:hypothetical protein A2Z00_02935 [Candidatus Gottesmanbacteria bacterium RBG_13_45_10]|uniref:Uncharacterized protein n=1 Tax=Candidatus Gottesmanbacteria bacterium RBG_13_45_10 TaxID=1798370 RepID=A0A1F5ZGK1_9BACT|nr:MAG: hypothetical protein A2Z00_02935 [Candidatus Gottesmanbacteria bacterium RBG_13_45_10]